MENFFGIGTADSFYDKRRHVNAVLMIFLDYHFYASPGYADRLVALLKSPKSEAMMAIDICNDFLSYEEHSFMNVMREKYGLPEGDFTRIMSAISIRQDKQFRTPASYDKVENTRLLVDMVVALSIACDNFQSPAFTRMTASIGTLARGMRGITFDQAKFERLFHLTFEAERLYQDTGKLKQTEDYVIARW